MSGKPDAETLIQQTLENAVRAPYYRRRFGARWRRIRSPDDLARLPILDKATAIAHQRALVVGEPPDSVGVVSTGTTRTGEALHVFHSDDEQRAFDEAADAPAASGSRPRELTLVVQNVHHGLSFEPPAEDEVFVPWMSDRNALLMIERALESGRVTAMRLSTGALKVFTAWQLERGKDPRRFGVKLIGTNSFRPSDHWRALVEASFGARLYDNYSVSEFRTPATECDACGWLHFGWPPVAWELVDARTHAPREDRPGKLVLTGLYPWVQKMPLIRYDTGDVAEVGPFCREANDVGVRCLGRLKRAVVVPLKDGADIVLPSAHVQDVLEALPETEKTRHPCTTLGIVQSRDIGLPRWTAALEDGTAVLRFEVRFDPSLYAARARALEADVGQAVLARDRRLAALVKAQALGFAVQAARAGSLDVLPDKLA